jgi:hypothetical protein
LETFLFSPSRNFFANYVSQQNFADTFHQLLASPPLIRMSAQNYHPETIKNNAIKYVTSIEDENFKYYSYRDISGPILIPKSNYLTIEIDYECFPSDAMTCMDYVEQKRALLQRNIGQDLYTKYLPESRVKNQKFFLSTHSYCGCFIMFFQIIFWILFWLSGMIWIHDIMFVVCCKKDHKIKIRKIYSSRFDLTNSENDSKFKKLNPSVVLTDISSRKLIEPKTFGRKFELFKRASPTQQEISMSAIYERYFPQNQLNGWDSLENDIINIREKVLNTQEITNPQGEMLQLPMPTSQ